MELSSWLDELDYQLIQGDLDAQVEDVIYDSRKAGPGKVFVCMRGTKVDSHQFIPDVYREGVRVFVVEKSVKLPEGAVVLLVKNGRNALACLSAARFGYPAKKMTTIGVTGTKGKTTTAHMIRTILERAGKTTGMIGTTGISFGGSIMPTVNTTPESYQIQKAFFDMAQAGCEYAVMEVSSQGIKMNRVDGLFFDYGIFTNISPDHIGPDEHADFEEYLYYKSQLLSRCKIGIVNRDDVHFEQIANSAGCRLYTYGLESMEADFRAVGLRVVARPGFVGSEFQVEGAHMLEARVGIPGRFNAYNALAAISVCCLLGLSEAGIAFALENVKVNGRMEIVHSSSKCTVIIDYAHNAVSMESLLETLRDYHPKRLVCVFGCGGNRSKDRRYSMGEIAGKLADLSIITADNSRYEKVEDIIADIRSSIEKTGGNFLEIPDRREAIFYSISHAREGDMIAIIGKGHEDYQEIEGVRHPFLDRAVAEEAVAAYCG